MDRVRFCEAMAGQRAHCEARSPFYAAVLREIEADALEAPPWLDALERAWQERRFTADREAAHLLLACLHFWALRGEAPELAALYPSCGGAGGEPRGAVRDFLRRAPEAFWQQLRLGSVQTNEENRSVPWMVAAAAAFGRRALPFHLVELGASAGLNLIGDHLPQTCTFTRHDGRLAAAPAGWNRRHRARTRTGLDLCPRRLTERADRLWLQACVRADDLQRLERLERATRTYLRLEAQASGPVLVRCAFADAPAWLLENRPPRPHEGLLVYNTIATICLEETDYEALKRGMAQALAPWQERALWVEYERARGATQGPLELTVHRMVDGRLQSRTFASGAPRPDEIRVRESWEALMEGNP